MIKLSRYLLPVVFFWGALLPVHGNAAPAGEKAYNGSAGGGSGSLQDQPGGTEQNEYDAILDRMGQEKQKEYLASLKGINTGLKNAYSALVKNYTAYRVNYDRTKSDIQNRRSTPNYIFKNMENLDAEREKMEADIKTGETKKKDLAAEIHAFYQGKMPQELAQEWDKEEEEYAKYLNALYRQVGWWMQIEDSRQWRNDESQLWDYLRRYYQDHPKELDMLK